MSCPDYSDILDNLRNPKTPGYVEIESSYNYDFSNNSIQQRYKFPYELIKCDDECKQKLNKAENYNIPNPFIKKNEIILEESKNTTNKTYLFLYIWFILMVIVIYVFIIAIVSENSYHPLMNIVIFIFLVYMSYYILNNLSL